MFANDLSVETQKSMELDCLDQEMSQQIPIPFDVQLSDISSLDFSQFMKTDSVLHIFDHFED
jgi:hypothetical protein